MLGYNDIKFRGKSRRVIGALSSRHGRVITLTSEFFSLLNVTLTQQLFLRRLWGRKLWTVHRFSYKKRQCVACRARTRRFMFLANVRLQLDVRANETSPNELIVDEFRNRLFIRSCIPGLISIERISGVQTFVEHFLQMSKILKPTWERGLILETCFHWFHVNELFRRLEILTGDFAATDDWKVLIKAFARTFVRVYSRGRLRRKWITRPAILRATL